MKSIIWALILHLLFIIGCSQDQQEHETPKHDQEAAKKGVLILDSLPKLRQSGCKKLIVNDDAAETFYSPDNPIPDGYCLIDVGKKAIPYYEKARRDRGLPPGSYRAFERRYREIEKQLEKYGK